MIGKSTDRRLLTQLNTPHFLITLVFVPLLRLVPSFVPGHIFGPLPFSYPHILPQIDALSALLLNITYILIFPIYESWVLTSHQNSRVLYLTVYLPAVQAKSNFHSFPTSINFVYFIANLGGKSLISHWSSPSHIVSLFLGSIEI